MVVRASMAAVFFASVLVAPWWLTICCGLFLLSFFESAVVVIIGGVLMDLIFGTPIPALGGFHYLYTTLFIFLAAVSWYLHRALSE